MSQPLSTGRLIKAFRSMRRTLVEVKGSNLTRQESDALDRMVFEAHQSRLPEAERVTGMSTIYLTEEAMRNLPPSWTF